MDSVLVIILILHLFGEGMSTCLTLQVESTKNDYKENLFLFDAKLELPFQDHQY